MDIVEPTLGRSVKIWWSFAWRSLVFWLVLVLPIQGVAMYYIFRNMPYPGPGANAGPAQFGHLFAVFPLIWLVGMSLMVLSQTLAMRWMIRSTEWSDFKLVLTHKDD